jgi:hypothetical protein
VQRCPLGAIVGLVATALMGAGVFICWRRRRTPTGSVKPWGRPSLGKPRVRAHFRPESAVVNASSPLQALVCKKGTGIGPQEPRKTQGCRERISYHLPPLISGCVFRDQKELPIIHANWRRAG